MIEDLDLACHQSMDPPDPEPCIISERLPSQSGAGRPKVTIDPDWLAYALEFSGPKDIGDLLGCSARSVRRRALELGLAQPSAPVRTTLNHDDGTTTVLHSSTSQPVSAMSDHDLDAHVGHILEIFPSFGQQMISGHLRSAGHRVPLPRIAESYVRVHGAPGVFGQRQIDRKIYKVAGPNSLWHHDGQHGMLILSRFTLSTND